MKYRNNVPIEPKGLGKLKTVSFSGGRLSVDMANHGGLFNVKYFGKQRLRAVKLYNACPLSSWTELFRTNAVIDGHAYYLEFNDTEFYSYGYKSFCELRGVKFCHEFFVLNDSMHFRITNENPENKNVVIRMSLNETGSKVSAPYRSWDIFQFNEKNNSFVATAKDSFPEYEQPTETTLAQEKGFDQSETNCAEVWVGITANQKITSKSSHPRFHRIEMNVADSSEPVIFSAVFAPDKSTFDASLDNVKDHGEALCDACIRTWQSSIEDQPQIACNNEVIQSALNNSRTALESLMVKDIPGGQRAADSNYWIWGWDSMVYPEAYLLTNNFEFPLQMLDYYKSTADKELGIFHAMTLDGRPHLAMANAPQTLYCILLYKYFCHTRDMTVVEKYYDFALAVIARAASDEVGDSGLLEGVGLYPDYPEDIDQNGHDISIFNNGIYYQALKCMSVLAKLIERKEDAKRLATQADKCLESIKQYLFDYETGYFFDSISSEDFSPRKHYPAYAILWITTFAEDLVDFEFEKIVQFMADNFTGTFGPIIMPRWDTAWMLDGNQLAMYMPVIEKFYREMMQRGNRQKELQQWFETVEFFWSQLTFPEAMTARVENRTITPDLYGRKQGFTIKSWYSIFIGTICGITFDHNGIVFRTPATKSVNINNLKYGQEVLNITIDNDRCMRVNGKTITAGAIYPTSKI